MKKRLKYLAIFLSLVLLATSMPVAAASSSTASGAAASQVKLSVPPEKGASLGDSKLGAKLGLPQKAFDVPVELSLKRLSPTTAMKTKDFSILGSPIAVNVTGQKSARLNAPATITINVPAKQLAAIPRKDDIYAAYFNGRSWEYAVPTKVDAKNGIVQFKTYHFSDYAVGKLSESAQLDRFATQMAINGWVKSTSEKNFIEATQVYFYEAFEKMGISDRTVQGKILRSIVKEQDYGALLVAIEANDMTAFGTKVGELTGSAILNMYEGDPKFMGGASTITGTAASALGALAGGDPVAAQKAIASGMMEYYPVTKALKTAVEIIDYNIQDWTDSEIESAYQAFKNGAVHQRGYNVTKGNFEELFLQMRGISHKLTSDAIAAYCAQNGVKASDLSQDTLDQIRNKAEAQLKKRFETRLSSETAIQKQKAYYLKAITVFRKMKLLDRGSFGFAVGDNIDDRVRRLFVVKDNIQNIIGKEIPLEDMSILIGAWYNDRTKTKTAFFAKLRAMGYAKKPAATTTKPTGTYAWVLSDTVSLYDQANWDHNFKSPVYDYEPKHSPGSYSVKTIYEGDTDNYYTPPYVHGEALTVEANWSLPPSVIKAGDIVALNVKIGAPSNTQSAYKFSGSTRAFLNSSNMTNKDGKYHYECKFGNQYATQTDTVSAKAPTGSKPGDTMTIEITFYSTGSLGHKFVYVWKQQ